MSDDAFWKFELAVDAMARSAASIQQRLSAFAADTFMLASSDIPTDVGIEFDARQEFEKLRSMLTSGKPIGGRPDMRVADADHFAP